ncbi:hypothetical protein G7Y89_g4054 [Cudoniella acicularis]|uniref:Uncharacterized protein n=1 Tax=Cudoniella acicularis TaxID=354080 RepID=A0A8H4W5C7_9HELO|nr:hypothetical protein G7Y89_g4054 [Cudoniella acicularis]
MSQAFGPVAFAINRRISDENFPERHAILGNFSFRRLQLLQKLLGYQFSHLRNRLDIHHLQNRHGKPDALAPPISQVDSDERVHPKSCQCHGDIDILFRLHETNEEAEANLTGEELYTGFICKYGRFGASF